MTDLRDATVTVAIACYNQGHFLADALTSVLAQTRLPDAIIVVDDGSTDNSAAVAAGFADIQYIHQANAGLSSARNRALAAAQTSHILFLDADDMLWPTMIAVALACFDAHPAIAFSYGGYRNVAVDRTPLSNNPARHTADPFLALLHDNFIGMHGTVLYDLAKLRQIGGFDIGLRSCEDYDVYLKLARHHPLASYAGCGADYRRHGAGLSTSAARMSRIVRLVLQRQIDQGLTPEQRAMARAGLTFNRSHYSYQLIGMLRRQPRAFAPLIGAGLRADPAFLFRLMRAMVRRRSRTAR